MPKTNASFTGNKEEDESVDFKANPFPENLNNEYQKLKISQTAYIARCAAGAFAQLGHDLLQEGGGNKEEGRKEGETKKGGKGKERKEAIVKRRGSREGGEKEGRREKRGKKGEGLRDGRADNEVAIRRWVVKSHSAQIYFMWQVPWYICHVALCLADYTQVKIKLCIF